MTRQEMIEQLKTELRPLKTKYVELLLGGGEDVWINRFRAVISMKEKQIVKLGGKV